MNIDIFYTLSSLLHVDIVYENSECHLTSYSDTIEFNLLMQSRSLRMQLTESASSQDVPFLMQDPFHCFYASFSLDHGTLLIGPMCHEHLDHLHRRQMYCHYGIQADGLPELPAFSLPEIAKMVRLTCHIAGMEVQEDLLLKENNILTEDMMTTRQEQVRFVLNEEEENDDSAFRHSYHEEQLLLQAVKEGDGDKAVRLAEEMDRDAGRLSASDHQHRKNMAIVGITLCSRAAIEGGISPEAAYRISGYYIQKCDASRDTLYMLQYRNQAIREFASYVLEKQKHLSSSGYIEGCRDYIRKHYREKIYLQDIADFLGISPSYLSRLFKKETGRCLQDFVNEERIFRSSNLLLYSDLSLSEIAQYVHFPSQSYFGSIFKKYKGMSPKTFRDRYRTAGFSG